MPSLLTPDPGLLFWMLLAFVIVFIILAKFGFPVITKMVEDRKNYIDESLKKAREANEKLANIQSESELIMRQAREKQAEILKEAMATRDNIIKEARDKADIESKKIIESAKEQIKVEKDLAKLFEYLFILVICSRYCIATTSYIPYFCISTIYLRHSIWWSIC